MWGLTEAGKQELLQQDKPCLYTGSCMQPFTNFTGVMSPKRIQRNDLTIQFREGQPQEGVGSARFKMHAEKLNVQRPVDTVICIPDPYPPALSASNKRLGLVRFIHVERSP